MIRAAMGGDHATLSRDKQRAIRRRVVHAIFIRCRHHERLAVTAQRNRASQESPTESIIRSGIRRLDIARLRPLAIRG